MPSTYTRVEPFGPSYLYNQFDSDSANPPVYNSVDYRLNNHDIYLNQDREERDRNKKSADSCCCCNCRCCKKCRKWFKKTWILKKSKKLWKKIW